MPRYPKCTSSCKKQIPLFLHPSKLSYIVHTSLSYHTLAVSCNSCNFVIFDSNQSVPFSFFPSLRGYNRILVPIHAGSCFPFFIYPHPSCLMVHFPTVVLSRSTMRNKYITYAIPCHLLFTSLQCTQHVLY